MAELRQEQGYRMVKMPEQPRDWNKQRGESLMEDLDVLLGDLCVIWGLCNGLTGWELRRDGNTITADDFARAVLAAEQENPSEGITSAAASAWYPKIRGAFVTRYGETVSEKTFRPCH
jgi:hypothetical protein